MLKTLLGRVGQSKFAFDTLQSYIIAASFPKMLHRMDNRRTLAKCYYDCLIKTESKTFDYRDPPMAMMGSMNKRRDDKLFLEYLPSLIKFSNTLPNLTKISTLRAEERPSEIYNKETYMEFHRLLINLLKHFHTSLTNLQRIQASSSRNLTEITNELSFVQTLGRCLRATVRCGVMERHLITIEHLLVADYHEGELGTGKTSFDAPPEDEDAQPEEETEFDALKPSSMRHGQPLRLWQSYQDWLRVLVIYFDASSILKDHIKRHFPANYFDIDIMILAPSLPDQEMLPWKQLLRHESYFPRLPNVSEQPSADELITFLTFEEKEEGKRNMTKDSSNQKRFSIEQLREKVEGLKIQQENAIADRGADMDDLSAEAKLVIEKMSRLKNYSLPEWDQYTFAIREQVESLTLPNQTGSPQARLDVIREIVKNCETLRRHSVLYDNLKEGSLLSLGTGFKGTRHCEVCIASLIGKPGPTVYEELLKDFAVSRISMLCLDIC